MSDLVERLRALADSEGLLYYSDSILVDDAADRIERLEATVGELITILEKLRYPKGVLLSDREVASLRKAKQGQS